MNIWSQEKKITDSFKNLYAQTYMHKAAFLNSGRLSSNVNHRNIARKPVTSIAPSCIDVWLNGYYFETGEKLLPQRLIRSGVMCT